MRNEKGPPPLWMVIFWLCVSACPAQVISGSARFGSASLSGQGTAQILTFSFHNISSVPTFQLHSAVDYSLGTPECDITFTTCNLPVTFVPKLPGLRQDAVLVRDANGALIASTLLSGIG